MAPQLTACHECDLLQCEPALPQRATVRCVRCGAVLYRTRPESLERSLAFTTGGLVLLVMANAFPIVGLRVGGELVETTLFGAARALYADGMHTVAAIVFVTIVAAPLIELVAMLSLLLPLRMKKVPRGAAVLFRVMRAVQPWRMVEVLMLGVLVALVKLAHLAEVIPGVALWSLGALVVMLAASVASFDPRELWAKVGARSPSQ